jgi:hypothetical protein
MRKFMFHETENAAGFIEVEKAYPVAVVSSDIAEAFGMDNLPNVIVRPKAVKKLKTITSYAGLSRFLAACDEAGEIPKPDTIKTPYAYSQTINTYTWVGRRVIVPEVGHRRFEVWQVDC